MFCLRSLLNDIVFNNDARNDILVVELLENRLRQQFVVMAVISFFATIIAFRCCTLCSF